MGSPTKEQRSFQVKMSPVLDAMRRVMTGRAGKGLEAARHLYEKEPREFLRLLGKLETLHERRKVLKAERLKRESEAARAAAGATTSASCPVAAPAPPAAAGPEPSGPLPELIARLLGG